MKRISMILVAAAMMMSTAFAQDGGALFKAKCAGCHGPDGAGKIGPKIAGKAPADVSDVLTNGGKKGPHGKAFNATPDEVKAIADYVGGLK
jgi:mono/diheme cytochrome c family protein